MLAAPDFSGMTKAELVTYAEKNGVSGISGAMRKADMISAIEGGI